MADTKWTAPVVRKTFLDFFEANGHTVGKWRGNFFLVGFYDSYDAACHCLFELADMLNGFSLFDFICFQDLPTDAL